MKNRRHHKIGLRLALCADCIISPPMHCSESLYHPHIQIDFGKERCLLNSYRALAGKKHPEPTCRDKETALLIWLKVLWKIIPGQRRYGRNELLKENCYQ